MKRSRFWDVKNLILFVVFAVLSCGRAGTRFDSRTYRIPWPSDTDGALALRDVEISTLRDPEQFSGDAARVLVEPGDGGGSLAGSTPSGRYVVTRSGVMVPADYVTMQAVTAYAHVERLRAMDLSLGVGSVLSYPLSLGVEVQVNSYGQRAKNNAIYDAKLDSLLLVPYDQGGLPIALNGGVLAHEHFHFLFQRLVMSHVREPLAQTSCSGGTVVAGGGAVVAAAGSSGSAAVSARKSVATAADDEATTPTLTESWGADNGSTELAADRVAKTAAAIPPRVYNSYVLRGLNEGFADFYGWLYSNDVSFLAKSLPDQDDMRRLDSEPDRLPAETLIRRLLVDNFAPDQILPEATRAHNAYTLGTTYARYLRQLVDDLVASGRTRDDSKKLVAQAMLAVLPEIGARMETTYETAMLDPNFVVSRLLAHLPPLTKAICASFDDVRAPEASFVRPAACEAFVAPTTAPKADRALPKSTAGAAR